ncbi:MAG: nucleotide sugar dehydrogenase [Candidatus Omnitrophica bacterium]|nr:nucleotide sugar dehydrogenase [Candidatus Omnitrophota bacterium]
MEQIYRDLRNKIRQKKVKLAVIGLGYVGLPLAVEFAKKGFSVFGIDLDSERIERIKRCIPYILDIKLKDLNGVIKKEKLIPSSDFSLLKKADIIFICVPTPLKSKYRPDISYIVNAVKEIRRYLKGVKLIVLESTTYPETTEKEILPLLESPGLRHGRDFYLAFSPERIDPANKKFPLRKIPKIIGGINKEAAELAKLIYKNIIENIVLVSSCRVAETVKLFENTFRFVNIALVDEMAIMAHKMDIDIWEVIEAAKTKPFGFMPFYPGPGVGGHCISKDPLYLYWKARHYGFASRLIKIASDIVNYMPEYVVGRISQILDKQKKKLSKSRILLIGVTYKKDVKDLRKSPALEIIKILQRHKAIVFYYDPLIPYLKLDRIDLKSIDLHKENLNKFDCVVITTDHSAIDYKFILKNAKLIFDTRNVYKNTSDKKIIKL